ncbi:uncharacterized protein AMSG_03140 [Thecamonas trahens ATCC 50062]|uniref:Uncharacterized protein n=1 Tax=Thecamonas trahens ATCC 50062 TaxID=461836 RepID=A0A0L0D5W8_THETB|nr:hypothetical protein AMSG_03140 [Thecamonas trahens ATCC 50062]KNC46703.1 hypothetical protein AMSG_03140 [Thecamonas trahens ATCC 50062]|eukprot:XP_013760469.1 hypothetical protein AMSG_03140 [Thecamonas trahens ATCC 50062]
MPLTLGEGVVEEAGGNGDDTSTAYRPYATLSEAEHEAQLMTATALYRHPVHAALDLADPAEEGVNTATVAYANAARASRATELAVRPYTNLEQMHFGPLGKVKGRGETATSDEAAEAARLRVLRHLEGRVEGYTGFKPGLRDTVSIATAEYARWQFDHSHSATQAKSPAEVKREAVAAKRARERAERHALIEKLKAERRARGLPDGDDHIDDAPRPPAPTRGRIAGCTKFVAGFEDALGASQARYTAAWYQNHFTEDGERIGEL